MKIIFLDVDGVLNTYHSRREHGMLYVDPSKVKLVKKLAAECDAKIVLSSSWRHIPECMAVLDELFEFYDKTPSDPKITGKLFQSTDRGSQIAAWRNGREDIPYVILDDDPAASSCGQADRHIQTDDLEGLKAKHIAEAKFILNTPMK